MDRETARRGERVGWWTAHSERFLEAAGHLPLERHDMGLPGVTLLATALELRLKAYLCAVRGGAPDTPDLTRLLSMALHCGLALTAEERGCVDRLAAGRAGREPPAAAALLETARTLCRSISAQAGGRD